MTARTWREPSLELRMNMRTEWIWELRGHDLHVVNRSDIGFLTRKACLSDARLHGFRPVQPRRPAAKRTATG